MKLSYDQIRKMISDGLPQSAYVEEVFDDRFIYFDDGKFFQVSYAVVDDKLQLGEKIEVKRSVEYVKVQAAMRLSASQQPKESSDYGWKWKVRVIEFGTDANNTHWTKEPLTAAIEKFEGAKVFMLSESQHQSPEKQKNNPFGKPPTEIVGWLSNVSSDDSGIDADLNILKTAQHLRDALVDSFERGNPDLFGLSVDLVGVARKKKIHGKDVAYLEQVKSVTVDIVYEPAAGGKILRMAAAKKAGQNEEENMWKKLLASLKTARPDMKAAIEEVEAKGDAATEDEISKIVASAMTVNDSLISDAVANAVEKLTAAKEKNKETDGDDDPAKILDQARIVACGIVLQGELKASGLSDISQKKLEKQFAGKYFETATLQSVIKDEKEYVDKLTGSGRIEGSGDMKITEAEIETRVKMLDDFFDKKVHSFKACYVHITGDREVTGHLKAAARLTASVTSTSWAEILGDSITRKMLKDYRTPGLDDWRKIVDVVPLTDFRTNRRVRVGGYGDLPTVAQSGAYNPLTSPSDEEATYAAIKKGGTEDITLEAIKNDDVGAIRRVPVKMSRAAKRTLYKFVFDFLATNPTIYDSKALFHADHGNLGSAALDATSLAARRRAILKQTETTSGEVLGIPGKYLVVPVDLDKTGYDLIATPRNSDFDPNTPDFTRTLQMELITVPYWADTNNWVIVVDPNDIPGIEIGFLDGKEEPDLFVQDMPNVGSMFSNDKLTYKIRHTYNGAVTDYRAFDGSIVV